MPCRQRPAGGFVAVVTKQIEAGRALADIYPARFLHLVQKGGHHVQAADPAFRSFYLFPPFAVRAALHRHHAVHLHLRHRGRPVCLQLCGQDGLCGGQPHHAAAHAAGHHRLYAGHRRQRHRGHHAGRGRPEKGRPLFYPVPAGGSGLGQCAGRAGYCVPAAHCRAAGRQGGAFGLCGALWTHPDGVPAHLCAAEYVPELFRHRRKSTPRLLVHRGRGLHQHGAGCADGGYLGLGRGGRGHCHLYQPTGGRRAAGVLLHRPQQLQPPAPVQDQFLQQSPAGCLHQRLFRADDQPFHVAGQYPVQLPAAASGR